MENLVKYFLIFIGVSLQVWASDQAETLSGKAITYMNDTDAILECVPDVYKKDGYVAWNFKNKPIPEDGQKYIFDSYYRPATNILGLTVGWVFTLTVKNVNADDSGLYTCVLSPELWRGGNSVHQTTELTVDVICQGSICLDGQCLEWEQKCDGYVNCRGGDDEEKCGACSERAFQCPSSTSTCINDNMRCDGVQDCEDGFDEDNCTASSICPTTTTANFHYFYCSTSQQCLDFKARCDGVVDCPDASDEASCSYNQRPKCNATELSCLSGGCLDEREFCNGVDDCMDASDEFMCERSTCSDLEFKCQGVCMPLMVMWDGVKHCADGSDEVLNMDDSSATACNLNEFLCDTELCLPANYKCDSYPDCSDGTDERGCDFKCRTGQIKCQRSDECIYERNVCDGVVQCGGGEDEMGCATCDAGKFQCQDRSCINATLKCDGVANCGDGSDERYCPLSPPTDKNDDSQMVKVNNVNASSTDDNDTTAISTATEATTTPNTAPALITFSCSSFYFIIAVAILNMA